MSSVISGVTGIISGNRSAKAATNAADAQVAASREASQAQREAGAQVRADLMPYADAGKNSLSQLMGQMGPDGYFNQTYTGQDIYNDPSYQFRLQQGQDSIQSGAASRGGLLSGATLKALQGYGQDMASQEFGNAYGRFNADQTNQYNRLASLVGIGQNASAQQGNAGMQTAQAVANNTINGGDARAAGIIGNAEAKASRDQAWGQTIGGLASFGAGFI